MLKIAVIGGDGIGPEVTDEGLKALEAVAKLEGFDFDAKKLPYGGTRYLSDKVVITDEEVNDLKANYDAIYLGAVGRPDVAPGILERGLLLKLRFELDQFINLRPVTLFEGIDTPLAGKGPDELDMLVVRENTEDLYCGVGGFLRKGTPHEVAMQEMVATRMGVERCLRYAFEACRARNKQKKLTLVAKTNVLTYAHDLWMRAFEEIGAEYSDITREYHHVDACCMYMVAKPEVYDTIVTTNMFGDIITDLGAAIAGGMGIAASGNLNPAHKTAGNTGGPSMFEPVHGSAPDIAGQEKANPTAAILSVAMLLQQTGLIQGNEAVQRGGDRLEAAVAKTCPQFKGHPIDRLPMKTGEVTKLILSNL